MKKLSGVIVFIVIVILLALAYTGFWFYQANHLKELAISHLKQYEEPNSQGYHYKVDQVTVEGYPFDYVIKLTKPRYEKANESDDNKNKMRIALDGALKIGTDIFGKSYWVKHEGDLNYETNFKQEQPKKYILKGNMNLTADVNHPQYAKAFMHPFHGFPQAFYKENPSFRELLNEIKTATYEDRGFGMYEVNDHAEKQLVGFSKGQLSWSHEPKGNENEKFVLNFDLKDFEASDNGKPLMDHFKQLMDLNTDMAVDIPYILGSGKNNITMNFEAIFPNHFEIGKFFNYKDIDFRLTQLDIKNLYGQTSIKFDLGMKENEKDRRNIHLGLSTESFITPEGSKAIHRQFIDGIKLQVAAQPKDPENKVLVDLLKCCEDRLDEIIPDYTKLGKMQFLFDTDIKVKDVSANPLLEKVLVNDFNLLMQPYGIKSNGFAENKNDQMSGKYIINWINYKEMIHDMIAYYNRIHPILEKVAEDNQQPLPLGMIDSAKENEIIDFFKSISDPDSREKTTIAITIDFTDISNPKIGSNSWEQVKAAWDKLTADIMKPEEKAPPAEKPDTELTPKT